MILRRLRIYGGVVCVVFLVVFILCRAMVGRQTQVWEGLLSFRATDTCLQGHTNSDNESVTANLPLRIGELADMNVKLAKMLELMSESENVLVEHDRHIRSRSTDNQSISRTPYPPVDSTAGVVAERLNEVMDRIEGVASVLERVQEAQRDHGRKVQEGGGDYGGGVLANVFPRIRDCLVRVPGSGNLMWRPDRGKYLLARCTFQQTANRLGCIKSTSIFAAMLNRTMIMPMGDSTIRGYNFSVVFDIAHARKCLVQEDDHSLPPIITLEEYLESHGGELRVEKVRCWRAGCLLRDGDKLDLPQHPAVIFPNRSAYLNVSGLFTSGHISSAEFFGALKVEDEILVIGDVFSTAVHDSPHFQTSRPFASPCQAIIQPDAAVMEAAMGFIQTFLGSDYMAAHWRRGDYFSYCKQCFHPIPTVTHWLRHHAHTHNATLLFLATNAHEREIALLEALLSAPSDVRSRALHVVRLPVVVDAFRTSPWAGSLSRLNLEGDFELVRSTLDRVVYAHARVFLSTQRSTFSANIRDLRSAWGTMHCGDAYICPMLEEVKNNRSPNKKKS